MAATEASRCHPADDAGTFAASATAVCASVPGVPSVPSVQRRGRLRHSGVCQATFASALQLWVHAQRKAPWLLEHRSAGCQSA